MKKAVLQLSYLFLLYTILSMLIYAKESEMKLRNKTQYHKNYVKSSAKAKNNKDTTIDNTKNYSNNNNVLNNRIEKKRNNIIQLLNVPQTRIPRFVALKFSDANLRAGPSSDYPIKFHLNCKLYPLEIIAEFENWRLVRDVYNNKAWIKAAMITQLHRSAIVILPNTKNFTYNDYENQNNIEKKRIKDRTNNETSIAQSNTKYVKEVLLLRLPNKNSTGIAKIETGTIVRLLKCRKEDFCKIATNEGYKGWIERRNLWGIYDDEKL